MSDPGVISNSFCAEWNESSRFWMVDKLFATSRCAGHNGWHRSCATRKTLPAFPDGSGLRVSISRYCGLMRIVDVVAVIRVAGELNAYLCTFNPAQLAGQRNILACDQDFERLGHVSERHRGQPRARQTHVFQFTEHTTSIVAYQQAYRTANFVARVAISSVVHIRFIQVASGASELKSVHSANEWLPSRWTLITCLLPNFSLAQSQSIQGVRRAGFHNTHP